MNDRVTESVMLDKLASDLNLEIVYTGRGVVTLSSMSVERPGLQLAGFFSYFDPSRIMVLGLSEHEYLRAFTPEERTAKISRLFDYGEVPCIILSRDLPALPELMETVRKASCPLFRSHKVTTDLMSDLYIYLNRMLAPSVTEHGVLMEVFGVGMLLTGKSGVGKSETAMELIKRGHRLIADDSVIIKDIANELYGTAPDIIRYFMELRGIGIINVRRIFGMGAIKSDVDVDLILNLEKWDPDKVYDRMGMEDTYTEILGVNVPSIDIPVKPGRNIAVIIEVAAMNHRQKKLGYNAAHELLQRLGMMDIDTNWDSF